MRLLALLLVALSTACAPVHPVHFVRAPVHLTKARLADRGSRRDVPAGFRNDASHLNETAVHEVIPAASSPAEAEAQLREILQRAAREGRKVSIAGAGHSMGGHTLYPGGVVLDMTPLSFAELGPDGETLRVGAGTTWAEVIPYLNERGRSVWVMQSNNDFTVGGSLSVNCHGWQHRRPPIASTVESFRLMLADGSVVRCSRKENAELFRLVLGGYGLFGVILEAELRTVPNAAYRTRTFHVGSAEFAEEFQRRLEEFPQTAMVYGRLSVDRKRFLTEASLNLLVAEAGEIPLELSESPSLGWFKRPVFRGSAGSDYGKRLRWDLEKRVSEQVGRGLVSRNQILHESAEWFAERREGRVDILQEYFVPQGQMEKFLAAAREIIPRHGGDLMNVTIRDLARDEDAFLRFATEDQFALVMLFHHAQTQEADEAMRGMTRELIDAALAVGGRYYLPYRLHATQEQFGRAYPMAPEFFAAKRRYDPLELFQNSFYTTYGLEGSGAMPEVAASPM